MTTSQKLWSNQLAAKLTTNSKGGIVPTNLTAQAFLIAHLLPTLRGNGVIWCLPTYRDLNQAKAVLDFWLSVLADQIPTQPTIFDFPQDFIAWSSNSGQLTLLTVAYEHLKLALPAAEEIKRLTIKIAVHDHIKPLEVIKKLIKAGFEPGPLPDTNGWFYQRGDNLTIASRQGWWRIYWYKNSIEKIINLTPDSETTINQITQIAIWPRSVSPTNGNSLANYLSSLHTVIAAPADFKTLSVSGCWPVSPSGQTWFETIPIFAQQISELKRWLTNHLGNGQVMVLTDSIPRLAKTWPTELAEPAVYEVSSETAAHLTGFIDYVSGNCYLTNREIYGPNLLKPQPRRSLAAYEKLRPGDYLVHIDHGIGRLAGLTTKINNGLRREYFEIDYAGGDKLFVPIEHTDRLSRYLGSHQPPLEHLSSPHWFRVQKKVKQAASALAKELLAIYAQRHTTVTKPWLAYPEEDLIAADFPYTLTPDQLKTWAEIETDLSGTKPMDRLICGDVGFGKTELALRAAVRAAFNGYQTAVLAPTTILAQQHFDTFDARLSAYGLKIGLMSRSQDSAHLKQILTDLAQGKIDIIIGTHSLLNKKVIFRRLGLLIIDEEQRFGVKQKEQLRALKPSIHVLAMSATPIPRSLHLAMANLRDLSLILTPPPGRQTIDMTFSPKSDVLIKQAITKELNRGGQIFYLVPRIRDLTAAEANLKKLFPSLEVGVIHGQKSPQLVAQTMHRFDAGQIQVLLATTIVENGLDLPGVNTLIVEKAHKFGLADLYQLKGRIGRSTVKAYAYFLTDNKQSLKVIKRLEALAQNQALGSGLSLALRDLELRGAGAILGREQHGHVSAVGLHLYGQILAEAIEEQRTGQKLPSIPEVKINLPLEGRITAELIPDEEIRLYLYQRLAVLREPTELLPTAQELLGRPLGEQEADKLFKNLLTLLEIKLLAERARLQEVACWPQDYPWGRFVIKFLTTPSPDILARLTNFDPGWHKVETTWQTKHTLNDDWLSWLKQILKLLAV